MINKQPTQEQIREFWEWCGFTLRCPPEKDAYGDLELDLNNLFKYAVPKLIKHPERPGVSIVLVLHRNGSYEVRLLDNFVGMFSSHTSQDPALALFWAIYEVIKAHCSDEQLKTLPVTDESSDYRRQVNEGDW